MMSVPISVNISAFKHNSGQICGLQIYNTLLYRIYSPQIGPKLSLNAEIKKKIYISTAFFLVYHHNYGYHIFIYSTPGGQNWKKKQWPPPLGCSSYGYLNHPIAHTNCPIAIRSTQLQLHSKVHIDLFVNPHSP